MGAWLCGIGSQRHNSSLMSYLSRTFFQPTEDDKRSKQIDNLELAPMATDRRSATISRKNKPFFSRGEKVERAEQLEKLGTESSKYEAEGGGFSDVSMDPDHNLLKILFYSHSLERMAQLRLK